MFLVFYRIKYSAAQHWNTEKSLDLWLWLTLNSAAKDLSTLAQHPRHTRISRRRYGHFSSGGSPSIQLGVCNFVERCKLPSLERGEDPAANEFCAC